MHVEVVESARKLGYPQTYVRPVGVCVCKGI